MPEIINNQRKVRIDRRVFEDFAGGLLDSVTEIANRTFTVAFISDSRMKELNHSFRGKEGTTDVLSFPFEPDDFDPDTSRLGDIAISAKQAQKQAAENNLTLETEIKQLILHGVLHLCGYDHETDKGEMNARELELRDMLGI
jgi:probable rRNA maturation factor